jgi:hypothetical protein
VAKGGWKGGFITLILLLPSDMQQQYSGIEFFYDRMQQRIAAERTSYSIIGAATLNDTKHTGCKVQKRVYSVFVSIGPCLYRKNKLSIRCKPLGYTQTFKSSTMQATCKKQQVTSLKHIQLCPS